MSEKQSRGIGDLSKYDAMTTEELEEILRLDAEAPEEQESDIEKILYIMEVLAERKRNNARPGKTALEAYESFKENYMPETAATNRTPKKTTAHKSSFPRWLRSMTAAAAVLVILIFGSMTAKAFGINFWKTIVQWTQETFQFGEWGKSNTDDDLPYASLQEALEKRKITEPLVPTWIPDGYKLVSITVDQNPKQNKYRAIYTNCEKELKITVQDHLDKGPLYVEQSEGLIEEYVVSGIVYYIFMDNDLAKAKWIKASYECSISGNLTIEEMKMMINSIEEG